MKLSVIKQKNFHSRKSDYSKFKGKPFLSNGDNNDYPTLVEWLVGNSITAKSCAGVIADFIFCKGFYFEKAAREEAKNKKIRFKTEQFYINDRRETPNVLLKKVAKNLALYRGVFLHINYNANYQKTSVSVLPYKHCRLGAKDSKGYKGKVLIWDNWDKQEGRSAEKDATVIDVYNPNPDVIQAQVEKSGGWENYKGQVFFLNLDRNDGYPLAYIDVCMIDCESERLSSVFVNKGFKRGFFGKSIVLTAPFPDKKTKQEFEEKLQLGTGADSEETVFLIEAEMDSDGLDKVFKIENIQSNINDKTFEYSDQKTANNIRKSYGNVPPVLIDYVEGKLGNTSGESLKEALLFMQNQLEEERQDVKEMFEEVFDNFYRPISQFGVFDIINLVENENISQQTGM